MRDYRTSVTEARVQAIRGFGFTERQARFLVHVMVYSGVFLERQYCEFARIAHGQRLQQLFFPEGVAFDGNRFNRTAATAPFFKYLAPPESADEKVVEPLRGE